MNMKNLLAASLFCGIAFTLSAQQSVPPPPKPANDAPANAEVLKLLRAGMSESVVLNKIRAITDQFDTSADALVALKQAGANDAELSAVLAQGASPAAQPPAAAPADNGPSLAETMQFIQNKLNGIGKVSFVDVLYAAVDGSTENITYTDEISNVVADPSQCQISYHRKATQKNGEIYRNKDNVISLRDVQEIVVKPLEQFENEFAAKNGINVSITTNPSLTILEARVTHDVTYSFRFTDADLADRVAKAMLHAVELCGGGNKEKF